ncbi:MAG TPA: SpoIIE family protein phosphatase [Thermoanaerobaculia bacterium]
MTVRKSTKKWLVAFAVACILIVIDGGDADRLGVLGVLAWIVAWTAGTLLLFRGARAAFRAIVRRLTLRLAFSYFLIGIVPIPLLAMLLLSVAYLLSFQFVGTRIRRELQAIGEEATDRTPGASAIEVRDGRVARSSLAWLPEDAPAPWAAREDDPKFLLDEERIWLVAGRAPEGQGRVLLVPLQNREVLQELADQTGYSVVAGPGRQNSRSRAHTVRVGAGKKKSDPNPDVSLDAMVRPRTRPKPGQGLLEREGVVGVFLAHPIAVFGSSEPPSKRIVAVVGRTSPLLLYKEIFSNWVPGASRIVLTVMGGLAAALLCVYLVALALAFGLVASITRNVNRMSRAAAAIARGDFSVRVNTKSRDQIGDLARSFDQMADSIQRLLLDTARKERLEGEIAVARTIQQKLLPPASAELAGARVLAHVQSVAEIGGDYYDYLPTPDGRTAIAIGDVSGHGLPTGLLVAMAKAALATLIETGLAGSAIFTRLNDLIHRSTDSRNYMTLALFILDSASKSAELTNAGQLAPYRVSRAGVTSLSLPSFPLGISENSAFPTQAWPLASGDKVVFVTDGLVECTSPSGEPFGFERLEATLARELLSDADAIRDAILRETEIHTGGAPPEDDRTMVIVTLA